MYKVVSLYVTTDDKFYFGFINGITWHVEETFKISNWSSNIATVLHSSCTVQDSLLAYCVVYMTICLHECCYGF
jgi:hypothetical protein